MSRIYPNEPDMVQYALEFDPQLKGSERALLGRATIDFAQHDSASGEISADFISTEEAYEHDTAPLTSTPQLPHELIESFEEDADEVENIEIPVSSTLYEQNARPVEEKKKFAPEISNEQLVAQIQSGNTDKIEQLIKQNMGLVRYVANSVLKNRDRNASDAVDFDDLVQEGIISMWKCALSYENRGPDSKFAAYVRRAMTIAMRRHMQVFSNKIFSHISSNSYAEGYAKDTADTRSRADSAINGLGRLRKMHRPLSLDTVPSQTKSRFHPNTTGLVAGVDEENMTSLTEQAMDEDLLNDFNRKLTKEEIASLMSTITDREEEILSMRFGLGEESGPHTREDIGREYGVTRERIRQIEVKALEKLREEQKHRDIRQRKIA